MLFNKTIQYTACIILLRYHHFCQAAVSVKISNLFVCFCSFDLSCSILEIENVIEILYIKLYCLIK